MPMGITLRYISKDSKGTVKNESVFTSHENGSLDQVQMTTYEGGKPTGILKVTD